MYDPQLTGFLKRRLQQAKAPREAEGDGVGIRARLTSLISELEMQPVGDARLPLLLEHLRRVSLRAPQLEPLLLQSRVVEALEGILEEDV